MGLDEVLRRVSCDSSGLPLGDLCRLDAFQNHLTLSLISIYVYQRDLGEVLVEVLLARHLA